MKKLLEYFYSFNPRTYIEQECPNLMSLINGAIAAGEFDETGTLTGELKPLLEDVLGRSITLTEDVRECIDAAELVLRERH